jgi:PAS domain S-box-containing protein
MSQQTEKTGFSKDTLPGTATVLLVDDKPENLVALETLLKSKNDQISYILCRSGEAALKAAIKEEIALILLDVQMPEMDGYEVARILKMNSKTSNIPIIFVTAIDRNTEEVVQGFESGAVDFLFKPLNPSITKVKVSAFIKIYRQNKELQQKNRLLLEKQQIIEETQKLADMGSWDWNLVKGTICFSPTLAAIYKLPPETDIAIDQYLELIHPEDQDRFTDLASKSVREYDYLWYEYRCLIEGKTLYFTSKFKAERDQHKLPVRIIGYSQQITQLRRSQALLERVFQVSPGAICTFTSIRNKENTITDFTIVGANKACEQLFGYSLDQIIGKTLLKLFASNGTENLFEQYVAVVEQNKVLSKEQYYKEIRSGSWFQIVATRLDDGLVVTFHDISEQKKAAEKLRQAHQELAQAHESLLQLNTQLEERVNERTKDLQQAERELRKINTHLRRVNADLDNFVYSASHDLKAPINNIEGLMRHLKKFLPENNEQVSHLVELIEGSVAQFKNILKELTEIISIDSQTEDASEFIELSPLLEEVKFNIKEQIESTGAIITEKLEIPSIHFFRKNLRSILYNLLSNAIKYRSPERRPEIVIHTYQGNKNHVVLSVQDNGLGIKKESISKMFDMFKRLHTHVEGTGVGLYLVKKIIDNAEGTIAVESTVNEGTTIKIFFKVQ